MARLMDDVVQRKMRRFWIQFVAMLPLAETTVVITDGVAQAKRGKPRSVLLSELTELAKLGMRPEDDPSRHTWIVVSISDKALAGREAESEVLDRLWDEAKQQLV